MNAITTTTRQVEPRQPAALLKVEEITFRSRNAAFLVRTSDSQYAEDWAVLFRVGPLGLNLQTDEARALGAALIQAANHFDEAIAAQGAAGGAA